MNLQFAAHERLVEMQTDEEIARKAAKARRRGFYTMEDLDHAQRQAKRLIDGINWCNATPGHTAHEPRM